MAAKKLAKPLISADMDDDDEGEGSEELVSVGGDDADAGDALSQFEAGRPAAKAKKKTAAEGGEEPEESAEAAEGGDDERLAGGDEAQEDNAERDRKRAERKAQKIRAKAAKERTFKELHFYETRNAELERRLAALEPRVKGTEVATVDSRISFLQGELAKADQVMIAAFNSTDAQRGEHYAQARKIYDAINGQIAQLQYLKQNIQTGPEAASNGNGNGASPSNGAAPSAPDPRVVRFAKIWAKDNPWYHPGNRDEDTAVVMTIDDEVAKEGYDPKTREYWDEFDKRVRAALPDRYEDDDLDDEEEEAAAAVAAAAKKKQAGKGGPRMMVGGQERPLRKGEMYIPREYKEALQSAGMWDDPKQRDKMVKRFHDLRLQRGVANP